MFDVVQAVALEEAPGDPLGGVGDYTESIDGSFYVADALLPRVRKYARDGRLLGAVGSFGDGPFEYRRIVGLGLLPEDARVIVLDGDLSRATTLHPNLAPDTTHLLRVPPLGDLYLLGRDIVYLGVPGARMAGLVWATQEWQAVQTTELPPPARIADFPYVGSYARSLFEAHGNRMFTGITMGYPIISRNRVGVPVDSITRPSWFRDVPKLEIGALNGPTGGENRREWFESFDIVAAVHVVCDSLLAVVHGELASVGAAGRVVERHTDLTLHRLDDLQAVARLSIPDEIKILDGKADGFRILTSVPPNSWGIARGACP